MVCFRHNAGLTAYQALMGFDPLSNRTPAERKVLAPARLDAWVACVTEVLIEKESRGVR